MPALPQVKITQELSVVPTELVQQLRPFIFGPEYDLHRYAVSSEKGTAIPYAGSQIDITWSSLAKATDSLIESTYTKLYAEDALVKYATLTDNALGVDLTNVNANTLGFDITLAANAADLTVDDAFIGPINATPRDVAVGDVVDLDGTVATITGLLATALTPTIPGTFTDADTNQATATETDPWNTGTPYTPSTSGANISIASGQLPNFTGPENGAADTTYTITVRKGSEGENPSTSILDITTDNGKDDVLGFVPGTSTYAADIPLGNLGIVFRFITSGNIVAGAVYTIAVSKVYDDIVAADLTSATSAFTGTQITTYILEVLTGGDAEAAATEDQPLLSVTTNNGYDSAANVRINDDGAIAIGNFGIKINYTGIQSPGIFAKGDFFTLAVTTVGDGPIEAVITNKVLPAVSDGVSIAKLYIKKDTEVFKTPINETDNWDDDADPAKITVNASIKVFDSTWDAGATALPIETASLFVNWREQIQDHADKIYAIDGTGAVNDVLTTANHPDNPLAYAANKAFLNSSGNGIRIMGTASDELASWSAILSLAETRSDVYAFVPLTTTIATLSVIQAHIEAQSSADKGQWRIGLFSTTETNPDAVVDSTAGTENDNAVATTSSTTLTTTNVNFVELGVKVNDIVRINYAVGNNSEAIYDEHVVASDITSTTLILVTAPTGVGSRHFEVWRTLDADEIVAQIGVQAAVFASRRIALVYPSTIDSAGINVAGYNLCAALGGLVGGTAPQQGLTNVEIRGFDNVDAVVNTFSRTQLDTLSDFGIWTVTHEISTGIVHSRQELTTDTLDLNRQEIMITKNLDSCSFLFLNRLTKYIGRANVTDSFLQVLRTQLNGAITFLRNSNATPLLGGQVIDGTIRTLRPHAILKDRIVVIIDLELPYPVNTIAVTLVI